MDERERQEYLEKLDRQMRDIAADFPEEEGKNILRAYDYARGHHEGQLRKSGEPYIMHPVSVAVIIQQMGLDSESIMSGLLGSLLLGGLALGSGRAFGTALLLGPLLRLLLGSRSVLGLLGLLLFHSLFMLCNNLCYRLACSLCFLVRVEWHFLCFFLNRLCSMLLSLNG